MSRGDIGLIEQSSLSYFRSCMSKVTNQQRLYCVRAGNRNPTQASKGTYLGHFCYKVLVAWVQVLLVLDSVCLSSVVL